MDPENTDNMLNHLEKQHKLLTEAHKNMSQELQKVLVEEEMMMKKFCELINTHRANKKIMEEETQNVSQGKEIVEVEATSDLPYRVYVRKKKKKKNIEENQ